MPLWTVRGDLMPKRAEPAVRCRRCGVGQTCFPIAERAGQLVPVGRGGERRAIAYANVGLKPEPYATPTLWAAAQYLGPKEVAPAHRHSQSAFRFVLEGDGVWTVVDGDPVAMRRGDLLLTAGWRWHEHHNVADAPMVWLDGLDIPLVSGIDAGFFEFGPDELSDRSTPQSFPQRAPVGSPGLAAGVGRPCQDFAAHGLPVGAHRRRAHRAARARRRRPRRSARARARCGAVHEPDERRRRVGHDADGDASPRVRVHHHHSRGGWARRCGRCSRATGVIELAGHEHEVFERRRDRRSIVVPDAPVLERRPRRCSCSPTLRSTRRSTSPTPE